ncbi:MAG TPA: tetratricopeptide repeat protein [Rhodothermales bacterium]|nr:tetratricopeptide repeat protein [Rhodothermales bacterium]
MRSLLAVLLIAGCASQSQPEHRDLDPLGAFLLGEAQQAYRSGAYTQTIQLLDSAEQYIPELADLWFLRGLVLSRLYRFDVSDSAFGKVVALDPSYRSARFNMGHNAFLQSSVLFRDGFRLALRHYQQEEALLRKAVEKGSEHAGDREGLASVLLQIGTTYGQLQLPDSAMWAYLQAIDVDSSNARGYAWLAAAQQAAGELEDALASARRSAEIDPDNLEHRLLVGVLLSESDRHEEALPHLAEVARREPWNRTAIYNLGRAMIDAGDSADGQAYLARADTLEIMRAEIEQSHLRLFQNPEDPVLWENYAYLLHRAGQDTEARRAVGVLRHLEQRAIASR